MRWDRLSVLLDKVDMERRQHGFALWQMRGGGHGQPSQGAFAAMAHEMSQTQSGVIRTNCIDCLDRTNVVQSMLARLTLLEQLAALGVLPPPSAEESTENRLGGLASAAPALADSLQILWADHADQCSLQYSGSPALKSDFTRTGKRTLRGILNDGYHAATRYIANNFLDGVRQDAYDLLLGNADAGHGALFGWDRAPEMSRDNIGGTLLFTLNSSTAPLSFISAPSTDHRWRRAGAKIRGDGIPFSFQARMLPGCTYSFFIYHHASHWHAFDPFSAATFPRCLLVAVHHQRSCASGAPAVASPGQYILCILLWSHTAG